MLCLEFFDENVTTMMSRINLFIIFQRYQQAPGSAPPSRDAPPPYPGVGGPSGGPSHGYGEGRGHYNRSRGASGGQGGDPRAQMQGGSRGHPATGHGQDRRSWAPPHSGGQRWNKHSGYIPFSWSQCPPGWVGEIIPRHTIGPFLAPTGAQGEGMYVCLCVCVIFFN